MPLPLKHPFTCLITGATGCGKTQFTLKLIKHASKVIDPAPEKIVWCYGVYQKAFGELPHVEFHEGIPDLAMFDGLKRTLLIIDDLMHEADDRVTKIFTKISHHRDVSVVYLTQNLFFGGKENRTIALNTQYFIIFKNPRDSTQIATLSRQMYPGRSRYMIESFIDCTKTAYSYMLVDMKPETDEKFRLRTGIFPGDVAYAYVQK